MTTLHLKEGLLTVFQFVSVHYALTDDDDNGSICVQTGPLQVSRVFTNSKIGKDIIKNRTIKKGKVFPLQARCGPEGG